MVLESLRKTYDGLDIVEATPIDQCTVVLSLFIKYKADNQDALALHGSLLRQMLYFMGDDFTIQKLRALYRKVGSEARPSEEELEPILNEAILAVKRVFIVVDALDECLNDQVRAHLMKLIDNLPSDKVSLMSTDETGQL